LCCDDPEITDIYVGSTCNFTVRKYQHKTACNNQNAKEYNRNVYKFIRENGGWDNWSMILIKKYPNVVDTYELHKKERKWLQKLQGTLNKQIPTRTVKEYKRQYRQDNKAVLKEYKHNYRRNNTEKLKQYAQKYYHDNLEKIRQYRIENKEQINASKTEKIKCECGCLTSRSHLSRHRKTKKLIELMNDK